MTDAGVKETTVLFGDLKLTVDDNDEGGRAYKNRDWFEEYRSTFYQDIAHYLAPAWVFDVGANYGCTGVFSKMRFPSARLILAEPNPKLARFIRKNMAQNGFDHYELFEGVVGDGGTAETLFHINPSSSQDCRVLAGGQGWTPATVPQTSLDAMGRAIPGTDGVYIKMDTQGYEAHVFKGAEHFLSRHRQWLAKAEFAPHWLRSQGSDPAAFLAYLAGRYMVCEHIPRTRFGTAGLAAVTGHTVKPG